MDDAQQRTKRVTLRNGGKMKVKLKVLDER